MTQNKHSVKSEYSKSFKIYKEKAQNEYNENVKFRLARRDKEVTHQPWAWLDVGISDDDETNEHVSVNSAPIKSNEDSDETDSNFDASGAVEVKNTFDDCEDDFVERLKERAMRKVKEMRQNNGDAHKTHSNDPPHRPRHPTKGPRTTFHCDDQHFSPQHRPQSSSHGPAKTALNHAKPFISYGWGAKSLDNNRKQTFNINSEIDVHPSAIRALKHLECKKQMKQDAVNGRPKTADPKRPSGARKSCRSASSARSVDQDGRGTLDWRSEYQQQYPVYQDEVYRRCLANLAPRGHFARLETPRTCRI